MADIRTILAHNILERRKTCSLSQRELARRLSITPQAVSKWERALSSPELSLLPSLARLLDCTIDDLFCEKLS